MDITTLENEYNQRKEGFKKAYDEAKKKVEDVPHLTASLKNLGKYMRQGKYSENGYFYIKSNTSNKSRKKVYNSTIVTLQENLKVINRQSKSPDLYKAGSRDHAKRFQYNFSEFDTNANETKYNFLSSYWPYEFQAHHLVPDGIFNDDNFTHEQIVLLFKIPYDLNHGENIIFLPKNLNDTGIHKLPQHNGSHPKYSELVLEDVKTLSDDLQEEGEEPCKSDDPPPLNVLQYLINLQKKYWNLLVNSGSTNITINERAEKLTKKKKTRLA